MKSADNLKINESFTIRKVLEIIDNGGMHLALVVDNNENLIGTVSDGDVRRAILKNLSLETCIKEIMSYKPVFIRENTSNDEAIKIALKNHVYQLPVLNSFGQVVGIKLIDDLMPSFKKKNKVVLMVGGLGTRLRPLTDNTPKPMLEVGGKPILETIVNQFKKHGFVDFIFCVNYKADVISDYFGDGSKFDINIKYVYEEKRMGTAGALGLCRDELTEPFFVMNGDLLTNINFDHLLNYHVDLKAQATMCVRDYDYQVPFGVVDIDKGSKILSVTEKPIHKFFVSAGIYLCDPSVVKFIPDNEFYDMPTLFEKIIENNFNAISFPIREYWLDIGRIEEFKKANEEYPEVFE